MWYYDPFIMVPSILTGTALFLALLGTIALRKKHKIISAICFVFATPCVLISTFVGVFGWILTNEERIRTWIGIT